MEPMTHCRFPICVRTSFLRSRLFAGWIALSLALQVLPFTWAAPEPAPATRLNGLFTDNMVLQRDLKVPIWGWAQPGQTVSVSMNGRSATTRANAEGKWQVRLGPFSAGGPFTLTVQGEEIVTLTNVLVGDVWICSGQSNMEMGIGAINAPEDIAQANYPHIRLYTVPKKVALQAETNVMSAWQVCTPETVAAGGWGGFTAVGYFFGRDLHRELDVPIGLIHTSWGGTIAEAWTSAKALKKMPDFAPAVEAIEQMAGKDAPDLHQLIEAWYQKNDPGSAAVPGWADADFKDGEWQTMTLPTQWETAGLAEFDGIVWFRKEFELPAAWAGKDAWLNLGPIDDRDTTYVNGVAVGGLDSWLDGRRYRVPGQLLKSGRNVIAVRVLDTGGSGGVYGKPSDLKLSLDGDNSSTPISLAGPWRYLASTPLAKTTSQPPGTASNNPNVVTVLYNGMIAPLVPFGIKGAIWYQGESNAGRGRQYRTLLPTMITDWRSRFGVGKFPFFIVQLANFMAPKPEPSESAWAEVREAQLMTAQKLPKTGLAVAIDIGEAKDIHPKNKQEVGRRLALSALAIAYGRDLEYAGPVYRSMKTKGNQVRLRFDHVGGGLVAKGGAPLQGFAIAGADNKFVWADAVIDGKNVVVSSPQIDKPVAVRYGWADNPVCNLYNQDGLPASPFRTDSK